MIRFNITRSWSFTDSVVNGTKTGLRSVQRVMECEQGHGRDWRDGHRERGGER